MHIDYSALDNCINPNSYGEICVQCNACGRFDKSTEKECKLKFYKEELQENYDFDNWIEGMEERQRQVIASNIEYFKNKIKELEE